LNLEKSNKKKSCVRKIFTNDETLRTTPNTILSELELFYSNFYKSKNDEESERKLSSLLDDLSGVPTLSEDLLSICEGKITYNECFSVLQSFQKNKTPGNGGLTVEFYSAFSRLIGKYLVECINYVKEFGELSNTQKQAILALIEKRGKIKYLSKIGARFR